MQPDEIWAKQSPRKKEELARLILKAKEFKIPIDKIWSKYKTEHPEIFLPRSYKLVLYAYLKYLKDGNRRELYQYEVSRVLMTFGRWWGLERDISNLDQASISEFFADYRNKGTVKADLTRVRVFLEWARKRRYVRVNAAQVICAPRVDQKIPSVMPNHEVRKILEPLRPSIMQNFLVLSLYAGIRSREIERLTPDNFRGTNILLGGCQTKTRMNRTVELGTEVLSHISFDHPFSTKYFWVKVPKYIRSKGCNFSQNILRHTAATHMVQRLQSVEAAAYQLGTSTAMLAKHYKGLSTPEQTKEFMEILKCIGTSPDSLEVRL